VPSGRPLEVGLNSQVPYLSPFSKSGWFFIEFSSLVDELDADWSFGHTTEKAPNPDPFKIPQRVGRPEKPNQSFDVQILKWYDPTVDFC
jgi:hypothetical protein